jgi:hypothetical protein
VLDIVMIMPWFIGNVKGNLISGGGNSGENALFSCLKTVWNPVRY